MSKKYQFLNNSDFHNRFDGVDSSTTNANPITTLVLTEDTKENFDLFYKKVRNHHSADSVPLKHNNLLNYDHYFDDDDCFQNHYSDKYENVLAKNISQHNKDNTIENNYPSTSSKNFMISPELASYSIAADDLTMETPLLQSSSSNNNNDDSRKNNNQNKHLYKFECTCNQEGFAANLNNNATRSAKMKILWAIVFCCIFMVVEFLGGYISGSLAVMTDAAHLASDCISFVIGLISIWLGCKPPDSKMSFGYKRFEVMGAIVSILGIWILTATLVLVAIQRIYLNDYDLDANTMMTISGIGILINIIMIFILHSPVLDLPADNIGSFHGHSHSHNHYDHHDGTDQQSSSDRGNFHTEYALLPAEKNVDADVGATTDAIDTGATEMSSGPVKFNESLLKHQKNGNDRNEKNLNLRAAMIHVIGDLVQSFGVFLAAVLIKIFPSAAFLDPLCTLPFSVIVIMTTINLFKESMNLVVDSVPQGISIDDLEADLQNIEGVMNVHHLNVWNYASNFSILMVHLVIDNTTDSNTVLRKATLLAGCEKYNIKHCTIQIERITE